LSWNRIRSLLRHELDFMGGAVVGRHSLWYLGGSTGVVDRRLRPFDLRGRLFRIQETHD